MAASNAHNKLQTPASEHGPVMLKLCTCRSLACLGLALPSPASAPQPLKLWLRAQKYREHFSDGSDERLADLYDQLDSNHDGHVDFLSWSEKVRLVMRFRPELRLWAMYCMPPVGPPRHADLLSWSNEVTLVIRSPAVFRDVACVLFLACTLK